MACSEVNSPDRIWQRHIYWNYNFDKIFVPTSLETKLETREGDGKISYELLVPWTDLRPYHPWITEDIGFNISFIKAVEPKGGVYYQVINDEHGPEFKKRSYVHLRFQKAGAQVEFQIDPEKGHQSPADKTIEVYMKWVEKVMK